MTTALEACPYLLSGCQPRSTAVPSVVTEEREGYAVKRCSKCGAAWRVEK